MVVETTDDGVTIREKEGHGIAFGRGGRVVQLEIDVPRRAEVSVSTASGWLDAVGLVGEQRYRNTSGDVHLRDGGGDIELATVSGDGLIELAGPTELAIKSVSGDVTVRGGRLDALRVATTSGDVRVDSPLTGGTDNRIDTMSGDVAIAAAGGIRVEARTVSGDLSTDLPHRSDGRMGRRTLVVGDGSIELAFRSVSGDLRIHDGADRPPMAPMAPMAPVAPIPPIPPIPPHASGEADLSAFALPDLDRPGIDAPDSAVTDAGSGGLDSAAPGGTVDVDATEGERMTILRALELGELDVATAMDRLAALDRPGGEDRADG